METGLERSFVDWSCEDVCHWLSTLTLSKEYSTKFKEDLITGSTLISLDREALEDMGITDDADRLKILQQITSMRADLMTSGSASPTRRILKGRRFSSDNSYPTQYSIGGRVCRGSKSQASRNDMHGGNQNFRYINLQIQEDNPRTSDSGASIINSPSQLSTDQTSSDSRESSRISTPDKQLQEVVLAEVNRRRNLDDFNKLQTMTTLRYNNVKRLSRSLDHLFPDGEDIFSVYQRASKREERSEYSSSSRLVEILREENTSLKQELETYYQRVRKLQKIEQEVEGIREVHRMLEASTVRREGLEKALRVKLEREVWRLKEESIGLKAELNVSKKQTTSDTPSEKNGSNKREIHRRDTMIMRLIKQNKEAAMAREQLEKDLHSTKTQLQENNPKESHNGETLEKLVSSQQLSSESDNKTAMVYSESIDKLKAVLSAMHNMSQKREKLEKKLRFQLEREIRRLKGDGGEEKEENVTDKLTELRLKNPALEADIVKWEHKCLELVAEQQMTFEAAVIPKEARIAALERSLAEKTDTLRELRHQKSTYLSQLTEANRRLAELEIKLTSALSSLQEKDTVIHMMQKSFLEPEDDPYAIMYIPPSSHYNPQPHGNHSPPPHPPPSSGPPPPLSFNSHHPPQLHLYNQPHHSHLPPPKTCYPMQDKPNTLDREIAQNRGSRGSGSYVDITPFPPPSLSSNHWPIGSATPPKSPNIPMRNSPLASPSVHQASYNGLPVKTLVNGMKPRGAPSNHSTNYTQEVPSRKNGYSIHHTPPASRYTPNPIHYHGNNISSSAPNSPGVKSSPRKPRISHPNMRLLQVPTPADYSSGVGFRQNHTHNNHLCWKSNTGPVGTRRGNYKAFPSPREVKSKTPPPDYRLVSVSGGRGGGKPDPPQVQPTKQRHKSVEDMLGCDYESGSAPQHQDTPSLELFQSLIRQSNGGSTQQSVQSPPKRAPCCCPGLEGVANDLSRGHQHSKSSPTNNQIRSP